MIVPVLPASFQPETSAEATAAQTGHRSVSSGDVGRKVQGDSLLIAAFFAMVLPWIASCSEESTYPANGSIESATTGGSGNVEAAGTGGSGNAETVLPFEGTNSGLEFSVTRGVFDEPFELTIRHGSATSVRYSIDGSDPRTSPTAIEAALPLVLWVDPANTDGRFLAPTYIVRATVGDAASPPDAVATHSYLFIQRVVELSLDAQSPGSGWPQQGSPSNIGAQYMDYGMDSDVVEDGEYQSQIVESLRALPSLSLVTDLPNLFDSTQGIYVNAMQEGVEWERFGSIELLTTDGSPGFQANTGLRIRGGVSRGPHNPKHAFRLFFRGDYGTPKLEFALFGQEGASSFDKIDLRTTQNYSWNMDGGGDFNLNTMNRDVFSRDLQRELGAPYTRSRYYHLYLDGVYWGIFQTEERPEARYAETYLGGAKEDYDVVKVERDVVNGVSSYYVQATDGTLDGWQAVWDLCESGFETDEAYHRLEGKNAEGARDASLPVLVDVDNLIDYMLIVFYTANLDAPVSKWFANESPNNFFAIKSRIDTDHGFVFVAHDNEHTLITDPVLITSGVDENRVSIGEPGGATDGSGRISDDFRMNVSEFKWFQPQWLHYRLTSNANYRQRFATRARQLLADGGALSSTMVTSLFNSRIAELESAIIAESARWGDAQRPAQPRTKNDDWLPAVNRVVDGFLAQRTAIVIEQLTVSGLY